MILCVHCRMALWLYNPKRVDEFWWLLDKPDESVRGQHLCPDSPDSLHEPDWDEAFLRMDVA